MTHYSNEEIQANVERWLAALRDPNIKQCRKVLYNGKGYCCLGVAAHKTFSIEPVLDSDGSHYLFDGEWATLPFDARNALGLTSPIGDFSLNEEVDGAFRSLTELNDAAGWTFTQIADFIESNPPGLFRDHFTYQPKRAAALTRAHKMLPLDQPTEDAL